MLYNNFRQRTNRLNVDLLTILFAIATCKNLLERYWLPRVTD